MFVTRGYHLLSNLDIISRRDLNINKYSKNKQNVALPFYKEGNQRFLQICTKKNNKPNLNVYSFSPFCSYQQVEKMAGHGYAGQVVPRLSHTEGRETQERSLLLIKAVDF